MTEPKFSPMPTFRPFTEEERKAELDHVIACSKDLGYRIGRSDGAAVAFGVVGMFEAIRSRPKPVEVCHRCRHPGAHAAGHEEYDNDLYECEDGNTYCGYCADDLGM
jgi:hypothetical protein